MYYIVPVKMMEKEDDVRAQKTKLEEAVEQVSNAILKKTVKATFF